MARTVRTIALDEESEQLIIKLNITNLSEWVRQKLQEEAMIDQAQQTRGEGKDTKGALKCISCGARFDAEKGTYWEYTKICQRCAPPDDYRVKKFERNKRLGKIGFGY